MLQVPRHLRLAHEAGPGVGVVGKALLDLLQELNGLVVRSANGGGVSDKERETNQVQANSILLGKSLDGAAPIGPWLVTADLADGDKLKIECRVNGEVRQSSNTSDMVFNTRQLVSYVSRYMTLKAGDIIFTGTPEGVISGYPKDKQVWLKAGDKIVTSIEKLGDLAFTLTDNGKTTTL